MRKIIVHIPKELKASLERLAGIEGVSEAALIQEAIREKIERETRPQPVRPLSEGIGDPTYAERVDEHLKGFGED